MYYTKSIKDPCTMYFFNPSLNDLDFVKSQGYLEGVIKNVSLDVDNFESDNCLYDILKDSNFLDSNVIDAVKSKSNEDILRFFYLLITFGDYTAYNFDMSKNLHKNTGVLLKDSDFTFDIYVVNTSVNFD